MMGVLLDTCSGVCWSIVYATAIVLGVRHKTWFIPAVSICINLSWEFWVVVFRFIHGGAEGRAFWIQFIWLLLDIGVFLTLVCNNTKKRICLSGLAVALLFGWLLLFWLDWWVEFAFIDNALMSFLFILHWRKDGGRSASRLIAGMKLIGTLSATLFEGIFCWSFLALYVGGICLILDAHYLRLVNRKAKGDTKSP